ncbi:MAG: carboxypeptidase regulatory-like domain-containing protein [Fimbriimonadaceae bacterium]|nr:carboxypeptidase regulatory-like domain-containing protein [Fimbriimonadaceae bacterium]QYK56387.1 MAG: carboxypeptidase regulatory-like domain-containing protein [Fimbriimonadaceae bacterium]
MARTTWALLAALLVLVGCGGSSVVTTSTIEGTVLDIDNQPVRDATVTSRFGSTRTSATGAYSLPLQGEGEVEIVAEATQDGVRYRGRTKVFNTADTATPSANIVVGRVSELATLRGNVRDRNGNRVENASVYAYSGAGSSQRTFTDRDGRYELRDLVAGLDYEVSGGGKGFRSDRTTVRLRAGQARELDLVVDEPGLPFLEPPTNLSVTTWVSPVDASRAPGDSPYEAIKRAFDPKRQAQRGQAKAKSRAPVNGSHIEADLLWDERRLADLTGYGIYRGDSQNGPVRGIDFLPDPLAAYYVDLDLRPNSVYSYAVTAISALFPDFPNSTESRLSERVVARTLGPLVANAAQTNPVQFTWRGGSGAEEYVVFLFDRFPSVGVDAFWTSARTTNLRASYNGPALTRGRQYYFVVIGLADGDSSRTLSRLEPLIP